MDRYVFLTAKRVIIQIPVMLLIGEFFGFCGGYGAVVVFDYGFHETSRGSGFFAYFEGSASFIDAEISL